ncbi:hypothetical protein PFISCL1PPCAC_27985, partial [Pristionchus fissidentatus]
SFYFSVTAMNATLNYGLDVDRDGLLALSITIRQIAWPISVFIVHPFSLFVLLRKTDMDKDCTIAYAVHTILMMIFDVYHGLLHQIYALLPCPILLCTGILCSSQSPRFMMSLIALVDTSVIIPYLFVIMRMHQKILIQSSSLRLSNRSQALAMFSLASMIMAMVYTFGAWSKESSARQSVLQTPDVAWAQSYTHHIVVFGERENEIGEFRN